MHETHSLSQKISKKGLISFLISLLLSPLSKMPQMQENTKQTARYYQSMDTTKDMEANTPPNKNLPQSSMPRTLKIVTKHAPIPRNCGRQRTKNRAYQCKAVGEQASARDEVSQAPLSL
jgi:hypothetical protein